MTVESRLSQTTGPDEISGMRQKERRKDFGRPRAAKKNDKSKLKDGPTAVRLESGNLLANQGKPKEERRLLLSHIN